MRTERKVGTGVAVVGSLLLAMSGGVPALASSGHSARLPLSAGVRSVDLANATSTGFGGWVFTPKAAASMTVEFKIPTLTCTKATSGVGPGSYMLTGSKTAAKFNAASVLLECSGGSPAAGEELAVDGAAAVSTKPLHAGDLMKSTIVTSATKTTATLADLTKGHTFTLTKSGKGALSFEDLMINDSLANSAGTQLPVAKFGTISFSAGAVGGKALGSVTPKTAVNMQTSKGVLQILTGALTGTKKNAFVTTWKHS